MEHLRDFNRFSQGMATNEGMADFGKKVFAGAVIGATLLGNPLQSCGPEENIETVVKQKHVDPRNGFDVHGNLFLIYYNPGGQNYYINSHETIKSDVEGNIYIKYNPKNDFIEIDGEEFEVLSIDAESITYQGDDSIYIIEFNKGCVYDGISTRVKFDKFKEGEKYKSFDEYVF